jgi:hypothetical protein
MESEPRKSLRKQMLQTISKPFKFGSKSRDPLSALPQKTLVADHASPRISQELSQQVEASMPIISDPDPSVLSSVGRCDPATGSSSGEAALTTPPSAVSPAPALNPASGTTGTASVPSFASQTSASQITKFAVKGALGFLSSAAEGIPVPGVKGIFDSVIKVIGLIEVSMPNFLLTRM